MQNEPKRTNETAAGRKARLAAELRANLQKRKAQARARSRSADPEGKASDSAESSE